MARRLLDNDGMPIPNKLVPTDPGEPALRRGMNLPHGPKEPASSPPPDVVEATPRLHDDTYSGLSRGEELIGTASSHAPPPDRSHDEPSDGRTPADSEESP